MQGGLARGFAASDWRRAVFLSTEEAVIPARQRPYYLRQGAIMLLRRVTNGDYFFRRTRSAADIDECALALLDQTNKSRPFFAFVNYMDAHADYVSDAPFAYMFPGRDRRFSASSYRRLKKEVNSGKRALQPWEKAHLISQYDGGIAAIDAAVGELIQKLRTLGVFDQTLVIILADHGEAFAERGVLEHDIDSVHQELIGVPMLIKYPDQHEGRRFNDWVSQVDLMPTMLGLAGIASPPKLEGRSLVMQESSKSEAVFAETSGHDGGHRTILSGSMKLILSGGGSPELYNLASDPEEVRNLYSKDDPHVAELEQELNRWIASRPHRKAQPKKLDPAAVERLKSLDYVQ
jgi:arylsulfatase A-like enzyme